MLTLKPPRTDTRRETLHNSRWELRCSLTDQGKANFDIIKAAYEQHLGKPLSQSKFLDYFFEASAQSITNAGM
ncbi:MAG: hypothetical protein E6Q51_04285 [Methylophilus methylotrophus]|uniref:Uncharacterized protein n=1 Tax=Methylophilus methylotrophus TaxID=17 RepID=A0A5C7WH01_METME|nr:MAG: hypothetical protein E6Q51_04285 [Methylophilus methylotrophus]